jgi:formylglycine-generating enzyme required for sulfatase activity
LAHSRALAKEQRERARAESERAEQAERLAEVEARSARLFKRLTAALAVVSIVALASAGIAVYFYFGQRRISSDLRVTTKELMNTTAKLNVSLNTQKALSKTLTMFTASSIEELKNNPETKAIAENWEKELEKELQNIGISKPILPDAELQRNLIDLRDLIEAHNGILKKLSVGDLLEGKPTSETMKNFNHLYDKLKDLNQLEPFFDETSSIGRDFEELKERIQTLDKIKSQSEPESLMEIAETAEHTEAIYAAWIKFGELKISPWPSDKKDLDRDRKIRDRLKDGFEAIRRQDEARGNSLLQTLVQTGLRHEIDFIEGKKRTQDKILGEFYTFAFMGTLSDTPGELKSLEDLARRLADFVDNPDWPGDFLMNPRTEGNPLYQKTNLTIKDFENWLLEAEDYRKLESDPRQQYRSDQTIKEFRENIEKLRPNLPDKAEEFQKKLVEDEKNIRELLLKPAIVKNEAYINQAVTELKGIGEHLAKFKEEVDSYIFPPWCTNVSIIKDVPEGMYKVVLKSEQLRDKFAPLRTSNKQPIEVDKGSSEGLVREDFTDAGWPKYIASVKDPNVIFRFIPAGADNPEPFYIATHEITYTQYVLFLQDYGQPVGYPSQSKFGAEGKAFISWTEIDYPLCPIELRDQKFVINDEESGDLPVTYVTYDGAESYANWLGGQLPDAKQHRYACRAGTTSKYPWGENISDILEYAHVRANPWRQAAQIYNEKKDRLSAMAILPLGAVTSDEDYADEPDPVKNKGLILDRIIAKGDPNSPYAKRSEWPIVSSAKPNNWDLYDMIGNVWEWCQDNTQPVICGGSCLAPPECITDDSMYSKSLKSQYQGQPIKDKDIGFRVAVPAI